MAYAFQSQPSNYASATRVETPFDRARSEWIDRQGSLIKQARNWRAVAFGTGILSILVSVGLITSLNQRQIIPVVVTLDKSTGEAHAIGRADEFSPNPSDTEIRYFLSRFIGNIRGVPLDQVILRKNVLEAYAFLGKSAATALSEMMQNDPNNPVRHPGERAISVQPISVVRIANTNSFTARWSESVYTPGGDHIEDYNMSGTFTIDVLPPNAEEDVMANPLGIIIQSFQWVRELGGEKS